MYGTIYDHLKEEEIAKLGGKYQDIRIDDAMYNYFGEEGCCMADLCGDNMVEAQMLIYAISRSLDHFNEDPMDEFIYSGGMKNLEMRKYFSAKRVRAIRERTDLSQDKFAKKVGLKFRTYQNYEEGQRIPSRIIVNAMKAAAIDDLYGINSHRRITLNLNLLSETSIRFLDISMMGMYQFNSNVPITRTVSAGDNSIKMYWVQATDRWEDSFGETYMSTDYYPEDIAACIKTAIEYECDEILFEDSDRALHKRHYMEEPEYQAIVDRIKAIEKELKGKKCEQREENRKLIEEYLADESSGDPKRMEKWKEDYFDKLIREEKEAQEQKDKAKSSKEN